MPGLLRQAASGIREVASGFRQALVGVAHRQAERAPLSPDRGAVAAPAVWVQPATPPGLLMDVAVTSLCNRSDIMMPMVSVSSDATSREDLEVFAEQFRTITVNLRTLGENLQSLSSEEVNAQITRLIPGPIINGAGDVWKRMDKGENLLANPETRAELARYLSDVGHAVSAFVQESGDPEMVDRVKSLFQDPAAREQPELPAQGSEPGVVVRQHEGRRSPSPDTQGEPPRRHGRAESLFDQFKGARSSDV